MTVFARVALAFAALSFLAACASKPVVPFDRSASGEMKTIGLMSPATPSGPSAVLASSVGQSFGLVGALIDAGIQANRESKLSSLLSGYNFSARDRLTDGIRASLEAQGYTVVSVPTTRSSTTSFIETYPPASGEPKVDAYLDVVLNHYGYIAAGIAEGTPYRPTLAATVRLVSARNSSVLMEDSIYYNPIGPYGQDRHVTIAPDTEYSFGSFDTLTGSPERAVAGLDTAFVKSTEAIAALMR